MVALFAHASPAQNPARSDQTSPNNHDSTHSAVLRTLTTLREAHSLSAEEVRRGYPIHVRAVVTYYDYNLDPRRIGFFLQDASGSIYAGVPKATIWPGPQPLPGSLVDVTGVSAPGDFAPILDQAHITVIGTSYLPAQAKPVTLPDLLTGAEDGQWVQIEGVVHSVFESATNVTLKIAVNGGFIPATTVKRPGVDYQHLVDTAVRIRGNAGPIFNSNRQLVGCRLFFPDLGTVAAVAPSTGNVFDQPVQPVDTLLRFNPAVAWHHRVHVRGTVTLLWPGKTVCIRDSTDGLCGETSQNISVPVGSLIDLAGFTTINGIKPALEDAVFQPAPGSEAVAAGAIAITPEQAMQGDRDSELVSIDGQLIGRDLAAIDTTLILSSGKFVFRVFLPHDPANAAVYAIPIGSTLRITGICSIQVDAQETLKGYGFAQVSQFSILLRSPHDAVVLRTPSWWTTARIGLLLLVTLAVTAAGFVWVFVLRRRVEQQTRELRESRELYRHMAHHDSLTGLPTRLLLHDRLQIALDRARRFRKSIAILMLDLDRFKQINDSHGHQVGDLVLQITADRLASTIRKTDSVARMGGDEFVVLLTDLVDPAYAEQVAAKIVAVLSTPVRIGKTHLPISVSIGVCTLSEEAVEAEVLLQRVDAAMYRAKQRGRGCFQVFTSDMLASTLSADPVTPPAGESQPVGSLAGADPSPTQWSLAERQ
jgi:diguanylate cyclase (GGDEF)-like protein